MEATEIFVIAAGVFAFALLSRWAEQKFLTAPMAFVLFGFLVSPSVAGLLDFPFYSEFINNLAEVTLVLTLFTDASRINLGGPGVIVGFFTVVGWPKSLIFSQSSDCSVSAVKSMIVSGRISGGFWPSSSQPRRQRFNPHRIFSANH